MSELAVSGCTVEASLDESVGSITTKPVVATSASTKDFVGDNGIYFNKISITIPSGTIVTLKSTPKGASSPASIPLASPASIDIEGTADNVLNGSDEKALQKGDKGSKKIVFSFLDTSSPPTPSVTKSVEVTVEITDAGQTQVEAV